MEFTFDFQNVVDGQGISIAITGMVIVFFALTAISLFIAALPRILERVNRRWPEGGGHHGAAPTTPPAPAGVPAAVVAAIAFAVHHRRGRG